MATRRLAGLGTIVAVLALAAPLSGQLQPEYTWIADRPDGIAPIAVVGDRTYPLGELSVSYRFMGMAFDGQRIGESPVSMAQVLDLFFIAPTRQEVTMHLFGAAYGLHERVTLEATLPVLVSKMMEAVTGAGDQFSDQTGFTGDDDRWGFGDVELRGHLNAYRQGPYRLHATLGLSVPVGSFYQNWVTPVSSPSETRAPYPMQIGSGTWDLMPGFTFLAMNDLASTGIQVNTVVRLHDNELNYNLNHRFEGSVWGAYQVSDLVSISARLLAMKWLDVQGADPSMNRNLNPAAHPDLQGGTRVEMPLGMNVFFPEGFLEGHRVGIEASLPIFEDLNGPQLEHGWTITLGWEYAFSVTGEQGE